MGISCSCDCLGSLDVWLPSVHHVTLPAALVPVLVRGQRRSVNSGWTRIAFLLSTGTVEITLILPEPFGTKNLAFAGELMGRER